MSERCSGQKSLEMATPSAKDFRCRRKVPDFRTSRMIFPRESVASCLSIALTTFPNNAFESVAKPTMLSPPCSAWASMSAAMKSGFPDLSARIRISLGPGRRSMDTAPTSWRFASTTKRLPGPKMRSTGRIDLVPSASAAMAWAPPTLMTSVTPAAFRA